MTKLCQYVAVEKGHKTRVNTEITQAYHTLQKTSLLEGVSRVFEPVDEDGFVHPPEQKQVQIRAEDILELSTQAFADFIDTTATKDYGNTEARADIVVDGHTILPQVPVTHLLFLEKQLIDLTTVVSKLPVLDISQPWEFSDTANAWQSPAVKTVKTKKVLRNHVKAVATDKHPAQVDTYTEDIPEGTWTTIRFSGAVPATRVKELLDRVEALQEAVKMAREEANSREVGQQHLGDALMNFVLTGNMP